MFVRAQPYRVPSPSVLFVICSPALALPSPSGGGMGQDGVERGTGEVKGDFERTPHLGPSIPHPVGPILGEGGSEPQGLTMVRAGPAQGRTHPILSELQVSGAAGFTQSLPSPDCCNTGL